MKEVTKTILTRVRLVNWYGFTDEIIPIADDLTLISGENECGKSTILDAIKYAYTGDTQFNKASENGGARNIYSYTRCLIDATSNELGRPADRIPVVYTHIQLEYENRLENTSFVNCVIIETGPSEVRTTGWFAKDKAKLEDVSPVYIEDGKKMPYDCQGFQQAYKLELYTKTKGIELFMQMVGLKFHQGEVQNYQKKLRNIMTYNPKAKIQEFIKESVLEEHDVEFGRLKSAKKNIDDLNRRFDQIQKELSDIGAILKLYDEMDRTDLRLRIDIVKNIYKRICTDRDREDTLSNKLNENRIRIDQLTREISDIEDRETEVEKQYMSAKHELQESDVAQAILSCEQTIEEYTRKLSALKSECDRIADFARELESVDDIFAEAGVSVPEPNLIDRLTNPETDAVAKESFAGKLRDEINTVRDERIGQDSLLLRQIAEIDDEIAVQQGVIEACDKNRADYSYAREEMALVAEINREFEKRKIDSSAKLACEYVVGLRDEAWRDAIEAFLGRHRYAIIVEPRYFSVANEVLDSSKHRYVELVNTKRLMNKGFEPNKGSVYEKLDIRNDVAAAYFCFWLGRINAVSKNEVQNYGNAMSKEGKLARNMAVTYINTKKIGRYCLGGEAIELNRKKAVQAIEKLEASKAELVKTRRESQAVTQRLRDTLEYFRDYNWVAPKDHRQVEGKLADERTRREELIAAQKENQAFIALTERVAQLEAELQGVVSERRVKDRDKNKLEVSVENDTTALEELRARLGNNQRELEDMRERYPQATKTAVKDYDEFLSGENLNGDVMKDQTRLRNEQSLRKLEKDIEVSQVDYNNRRAEDERLPIGTEHQGLYQRRYDRIWVDDAQGIKQKLEEQTRQYERVFKTEFVLKIYETAKAARSEITQINKELEHLEFSTKYQFEVKYLDDSSDFAKILNYAKALQETNNLGDGQRTLSEFAGISNDDMAKLEGEIHGIINRLVDNDDSKETAKFADYRNYMSYEIRVNSDEIKDGRLSKQITYNSGAGTQIPYTLILSAALSMLYNVRANSTRLIFIDEPFEKMSDHNIKLMLGFFKNQNFQVVFCAPSNKLNSIGTECDVIIPVIKIKNDNMQIGQVRFHS